MAGEDPRKIEKRRRNSPYTVGIIIIVAGIVLAILAGASDKSAGIGIFIVSMVFGGLVIGLTSHSIKKEDNQIIQGTPEYEKQEMAVRAKADKAYDKLYTHKNLHDQFSFKSMMITGALFGGFTLINLAMFIFGGMYSIYFIIIDLCLLAVFIYSLTGKEYKDLLKLFADHGLTEQDAEREFSTAALVSDATSEIAFGRNYCIISKPQKRVFRTSDILWVFPRIRYVYNYTNGFYTGRTEHCSLIFATIYGEFIEGENARPNCDALIRKIEESGIICGYSYELYQKYCNDRERFAESVGNEIPRPHCTDYLRPSPDDTAKK